MAGSAQQEMACRELVEVVTDYLEGALPEHDRVRLEAHLAECPSCVNYIAQMRTTIEALGKLPAEPVDPAQQEALLEAFRDWRRA
jgi:anti-sigma factor RsiW